MRKSSPLNEGLVKISIFYITQQSSLKIIHYPLLKIISLFRLSNTHMGNFTSCFSFEDSEIKLFDEQGQLKRLKEMVKAAEIMLDEPGKFVCQGNELRRTGRIVAMRADDELLPGKVYLLVPASRINCKVSELEMAIVSVDSKRRVKRKSSKVIPAVIETEENLGEGKGNGFSGHRNVNHRQWNPVLEPILEGNFEL